MTVPQPIRIALIGGSGFDDFDKLRDVESNAVSTQYGEPSSVLKAGQYAGAQVLFLPRHGDGHTIPPHLINYRANMWALRAAGTEVVIALAAVGGITDQCAPGTLVLPDQVLDYTYGRSHTYSDEAHGPVNHFDFTYPYCEQLRQKILDAGRQQKVPLVEKATYAAVQGPRFETKAEVDKLERDGADIVGMTGMPETSLARELGLCYAAIAFVVNKAAGRGDGEITQETIEASFVDSRKKVYRLLEVLIPSLSDLRYSAPLALSG